MMLPRRRPQNAARAAILALALASVLAAPAFAQPAAGPVLLEVTRFEIVGANPFSEADTAAVLAPHLGPHQSLASLEAAATALENRLRDAGYSFHRVIIPAQKPAQGVVRLEILQFPLASVEVTGNQHFSADNIRRSLPGLVAGTTPDVNEMSRELGLANEHMSKRATIVLKESKSADALDAEIRVRDVPPANYFVSLIGHSKDAYDVINENTGYTRATFGYQNTNLFDRDHAVTVSYTTSPERIDRVKQFGAFYSIPFYGYNTSLQAYYTKSDVNTGGIGFGGAVFNVSGRGEFAGVRLTYSLPKVGEFTQNVGLAIDDRHFESSVGFAGTPLGPTAVRSRPLSLRYAARTDQTWGGGGGFIEWADNLFGGSGNTDAAYANSRLNAGVTRKWSALRYGLDANTTWRDWVLSARLRGQFAETPLIPGEQFGVGGAISVRGLREREFTGDSGNTLTLEALGPAFDGTTIRPLAFLDHGYARLHGGSTLQGTSVTTETATSVGVGARWKWRQSLDFSVDFAYVLNGINASIGVPGTANGDVKMHFALFYKF